MGINHQNRGGAKKQLSGCIKIQDTVSTDFPVTHFDTLIPRCCMQNWRTEKSASMDIALYYSIRYPSAPEAAVTLWGTFHLYPWNETPEAGLAPSFRCYLTASCQDRGDFFPKALFSATTVLIITKMHKEWRSAQKVTYVEHFWLVSLFCIEK